MFRLSPLLIALLVALPLPCLATFPEITLEDVQFAYANEAFVGGNFAFGTELKYTQSTPDGFPVDTTGLLGFIAAPEQITPIIDFQSGQEVPLVRQTLDDLFPENVPGAATDLWAENTISGVGDFDSGFTSFSIHQSKVAEINQSTNDPNQFADIAAITKGLAPFQVAGGGEVIDALMTIDLDSLFESSDGGFGSEGLSVQLLDLTDVGNPELVYNIDGFYFADENSVSSSFGMGDTDLTDKFTFTLDSEPESDTALAEFSLTMDIQLDPMITYGLNVSSDSSAGASGNGSTSINSGNTLDVTISVSTPGARLVIPGSTTTGPQPGDANGDGVVDLLDLDILGANFGSTGVGVAQGDFNGDGTVDLLDLDILGANFGSGAASIPEPTTAGLVTLLAIILAPRTGSTQR